MIKDIECNRHVYITVNPKRTAAALSRQFSSRFSNRKVSGRDLSDLRDTPTSPFDSAFRCFRLPLAYEPVHTTFPI